MGRIVGNITPQLDLVDRDVPAIVITWIVCRCNLQGCRDISRPAGSGR